MNASARRFIFMAALLLALATIIGALAAHALKARLAAADLRVLQTAVRYQFYHSLGLLGLGLLALQWPARWVRIAGWLLLTGIVLFSGSLYLLVAHAPRLIGVLTPLGGVCLIAAWVVVAVGVVSAPASHAS